MSSLIPYLGTKTEDIRTKINKHKTPLTTLQLTEFFESKGVTTSVNSLDTLVKAMVEKNYFFTYTIGSNIYLTYASDICFNYRDKYIFIPFDTYLDNLKFEVKEKTYESSILKKEYNDYTNIRNEVNRHYYLYPKYHIQALNQLLDREKLISFCDITTGEHYIFDSSKLPITRKKFISLDECHQRYIDLHKVYKDDYKRYINIDSKFSKTESKLRTRGNLKKYGEYNKINYNDVRFYKHDEMLNFTTDIDKPYKERLCLFEMELYILCNIQGIQVEDKYQQVFDSLGKTERVIKIGENYPLILKWYYKDKESFKPRSYDYFESLDTLQLICN